MIKNVIKKILNKLKIVTDPVNRNDRIGVFHKLWGHVFSNHLYGDYVEFGVYKGDSMHTSITQFKLFQKWLQNEKNSNEAWRKKIASQSPLNNEIVFHGLDTFSGMPDNSENNFSFSKGTFKSDFKTVEKKIKKISNNFILYKGLFSDNSESLKKNLGEKKIVIANLDCDIYQSTTDALNIIDEHLQIGSIIMFDDFNAFNSNDKKGQRKAFNEYKQISNWKFESHINYMYSGKCFLITDLKK